MNPLLWIRQFLIDNKFEIPVELQEIIRRGVQIQPPFYFSNAKEAEEDTQRMNRMFKAHQVVAFGRQGGYDGVICLVIADGTYPRGHVLVLHWDGWPGTEVDDDYPSLASWAKAAEAEISS